MNYALKLVRHRFGLTAIILIVYSTISFMKVFIIDDVGLLLSLLTVVGSVFMVFALKMWGLVFFKREFRPSNFLEFMSFMLFSILFLSAGALTISPILISSYNSFELD